jgi:hypothetical protein
MPSVIGAVTTALLLSLSTATTTLLNPYNSTDNNNHEPLHPSRILDARANWCVNKSIRQLPLDCNSATTGFRPREVIAQATHTTEIRNDKDRSAGHRRHQ